MKCHDVEPFFERLANPSGAGLPDPPALQEHLATCLSCQQAVQSLAQWDRRLANAMKDVSVPAGLTERIQMSLQHASPTTIDVPGLAVSSWRSHGPRLLTILASVSLIAVVVFGLQAWWSPSLISADQVTTMLQQPVVEMPESTNGSLRLPRQWNSLQRDVGDGGWRQFVAAEIRPAIAALPLAIRVKRTGQAEGVLFAIPQSRWESAVAPSISQAVVQYAPPYVWMVWTEDDVVFLLAVNGPAPVLEQLQRQLSGGRAVF